MLSAANQSIVRATLPVVAEHLDEITAVFYDTMLGENPELRDVFSRSGQATGHQRRALAGAVAAFARHLTGADGGQPGVMDQLVERIAHRHASLGIRAEQYPVVGRYLLAAVGTVLGDAVTADVAAAWDEVYWLFGCRLIGLESRRSARAGVDPEHPWRDYLVGSRRDEAQDTVSFVLTPADGQPAPAHLPGQYVTVNAELPDGTRQARQYTVSQAASAGALRITVRRVRGTGGGPDGLVSSFLHDHVFPGDRLALSAPYGDLTVRPGDHPLVLVSAGVGITPMAAILDHVARNQPTRRVVAVHADRSPDRHPLRGDVVTSGSRLRSFRHLVWYEQPSATGPDGAEVRTGLIEPDEIPLPEHVEAYLCGPVPFMRTVRANLRGRGMSDERIRYEVFGPDQWTATRSARD